MEFGASEGVQVWSLFERDLLSDEDWDFDERSAVDRVKRAMRRFDISTLTRLMPPRAAPQLPRWRHARDTSSPELTFPPHQTSDPMISSRHPSPLSCSRSSSHFTSLIFAHIVWSR